MMENGRENGAQAAEERARALKEIEAEYGWRKFAKTLIKLIIIVTLVVVAAAVIVYAQAYTMEALIADAGIVLGVALAIDLFAAALFYPAFRAKRRKAIRNMETGKGDKGLL